MADQELNHIHHEDPDQIHIVDEQDQTRNLSILEKINTHLNLVIQENPISEINSSEEYFRIESIKEDVSYLRSRFYATVQEQEAQGLSVNFEFCQKIRHNFSTILSKVNARLSEFDAKRNQPAVGQLSPVQPQSAVTHYSFNPRLPEISMPSFDGGFDQWLNFKSTFSSIVINNGLLDDTLKYHYLRQALSGEALHRIANSPSGNFQLAWNLLTQRYDNTLLIAETHVAAILNPPKLDSRSAQSWRTFIDNQKTNIAALEALTLHVSVKDFIFMSITISRFDNSTLRDWERYCASKDKVTLDNLWDFLESQHKVAQAMSFTSNNIFQNTQRVGNSNHANPSRPAFQQKPGNFNFNGSNTFSKPVHCYFCDSPSHNIFNCQSFKSVPSNDKGHAIKRKNLCYNCLRPFNTNHSCFGTCRTCQKAHHSLLHGVSLPPRGSAEIHNNARNRAANCTAQEQHCYQDTSNTSTSFLSQINPVDNYFVQPSTNQQSFQQTSAVHTEVVTSSAPSTSSLPPSPSPTNQSISNSNCAQVDKELIDSTFSIMPTAQLIVFDADGQAVACRALLDSGSDSCFISKRLADRLQLPSMCTSNTIHTVSGSNSNLINISPVSIYSIDRTWTKDIRCIVTEKITPSIPPSGLHIGRFNIPANLQLADPQFFQLQGVDMLLSVSIYASIIVAGQLQLTNDCVLQNTKLGWVIWGALPHNTLNHQEPVSNFVSTTDVSRQLEKFWKLEEIDIESSIPSEEAKIEKHYIDNVQRLDDGRFSVALPKREKFYTLGKTHFQALNRFYSLERRFESNPDLKKQYVEFMDEYLELGHMTLAPPTKPDEQCYHIPHHPVFKPDSTTTKLRVVFDASAKSNTGISLNEVLHTGHTVQPELFEIVLRFRTHRIAFIADITKMYRQILVHPDDRNFQKIFWRSDVTEPVQEYLLNTVTYGTSSAPYLATRTLNHLADVDFPSDSPVSIAIKNDFYVDDLISGSASIQEATELAQQLLSALNNGKFELRKWLSNSSELLKTIPAHLVETVLSKPLSDSNDSVVKALGLIWNSTADQLIISSSVSDVIHKTSFTKRELLSCIASIFDPLGLISPVVILPKMLFQKLWLLKLNWDHQLPPDLLDEWLSILHELPNIANITIPRCVLPQETDVTLELHAFSDASATAYGACLYVRSSSPNGVQVRLLTSKSRVASIKPLLTIPRLELQAAFLSARLVVKAIQSSKLSFSNVYLWTDSKIVCDWLKVLPNRSDVFVSVRISTIQNITSDFHWRHVRSNLNPADLVSRGCSPNTLVSSSLWWSGPPWLSDPQPTWNDVSSHVAISKPITSFATQVTKSIFSDLISRISDYHKMKRAAAYALRFVHNLIHRNNPDNQRHGHLSIQEIQNAEIKLIQVVQSEAFSTEINQLKLQKELLVTSALKPLSPFLHSDSLLRVGGRLQHSDASFDYKHQVLLPSKHKFTRALIIAYHRRVQHDGVQSTMTAIRQRFWIISTRRTIKSIIKSCTTCFRFSKFRSEQIMGQLPAVRVHADFPFHNSGIDYAGPFSVRHGSSKSRTFTKAYLAIFVCMVTRAVHVEVVTELTTKAFNAALIRFSSRRGIPHAIYSDNATTFVGARNELQELFEFLQAPSTQKEINDFASVFDISWHFIPPRAPHFGGLWENAVKNFKKIFRVVTLNKILNYEELSTFAAQIEAILNSRPLISLSEDPNDLQYISPAHFLIGRPITALPFHTPTTTHKDHRSRWSQLQETTQELWDRWSKEYLVTLQRKNKWTSEFENLQVGTIVILKDPGTSPSAWRLARITEVHPGKDNKVRVVTVMTATGTFKRSITSIAPLPLDDD